MARYHSPDSAAAAVVCDRCGRSFADRNVSGEWWLLWEPDGDEIYLRCPTCDTGEWIDRFGCSTSLSQFADREFALDRLASLLTGYAWTAASLKRLALIAWAMPHLATPQEQRLAADARKSLRRMGVL